MQKLQQFDPDIRTALTIDKHVYTCEYIFEAIKEKVFANSWQWAALSKDVKTPGQAYPFILLEHLLDEPLLFTRDLNDNIHCLSNVCTHRGNLVVENAGILKQLQCRYHGRRFKLDGAFVHMPEFNEVENFPSPQDCLPKVAFQEWNNILFANINPLVDFAEWIKPINDRIGWLPLQDFYFSQEHSRDYLVHANWALYCDNYLEGFHIPYIHPTLNTVLDYSNYTVELFDWCNLQVGVAKGGEQIFDLPKSSPDYGKEIGGYYFWLFPNLMLNFYPWGISVNIVKPLAVNRTKVSFLTFIWKPELLGKGAGAALDKVEREDEVVVEAVQKGINARLYKNGRYSVLRETGVHHFHSLLAKALNML